jgi:acyl-coenzyme A synthetase/AMP-(fatty) acid ligase
MTSCKLQFNQDFFITYQDIDSLSNDLANRLITIGIKRGALVALYMDKSIEMFLSILAIHKAGGYVPLDPEYPAERIRTIVSLAEVTQVLVTQGLHKRLVSVVSGTGIACVPVNFYQLSSAAKPDVRPAGRDDICHVLFTSGTTGTPKGISFDVSDCEQSIHGIRFRCRSDARVNYRERGCVPRSHWHPRWSGPAIGQLHIRLECLGEQSMTPHIA